MATRVLEWTPWPLCGCHINIQYDDSLPDASKVFSYIAPSDAQALFPNGGPYYETIGPEHSGLSGAALLAALDAEKDTYSTVWRLFLGVIGVSAVAPRSTIIPHLQTYQGAYVWSGSNAARLFTIKGGLLGLTPTQQSNLQTQANTQLGTGLVTVSPTAV